MKIEFANPCLSALLGIAILFDSINRSPLQFHTYPPYGLVTVAFIPLETYLLFVGFLHQPPRYLEILSWEKNFTETHRPSSVFLRVLGCHKWKKKYKIMGKKVEPGINKDYSEENVKQILSRNIVQAHGHKSLRILSHST